MECSIVIDGNFREGGDSRDPEATGEQAARKRRIQIHRTKGKHESSVAKIAFFVSRSLDDVNLHDEKKKQKSRRKKIKINCISFLHVFLIERNKSFLNVDA